MRKREKNQVDPGWGLIAIILVVSGLTIFALLFVSPPASAAVPPLKFIPKPACGKTLVEVDGTVTKSCRIYGSDWLTFTWGEAIGHYNVRWTATVGDRDLRATDSFNTRDHPSYYSVNPKNHRTHGLSNALKLAPFWTLKVTARPFARTPFFVMVIHLKGNANDEGPEIELRG